MKILYYIGDKIDLKTIVKKGFLIEDAGCMHIESENIQITLDSLKSVNLIKLNGLGTMIKIINDLDTIFLTVPRIFIDKGTGFAIINYFKTKKTAHLLKLAMKHQQQ